MRRRLFPFTLFAFFVGAVGCKTLRGASLPTSGLECPGDAVPRHADDGERGRREWCEVPSGEKDCRFYAGTCEVPGTSEGPWAHYYANGSLAELTFVVHGALSGTAMKYFPSGAPRRRTNWVTSSREGEEDAWFENGFVETHGAYLRNRRNGEWIGWYPSGRPAWRGSYREGVPFGPWAFWNEDGSIAYALAVSGSQDELHPEIALQFDGDGLLTTVTSTGQGTSAVVWRRAWMPLLEPY